MSGRIKKRQEVAKKGKNAKKFEKPQSVKKVVKKVVEKVAKTVEKKEEE